MRPFTNKNNPSPAKRKGRAHKGRRSHLNVRGDLAPATGNAEHRLSSEEQESILSWNESDAYMELYTASASVRRRLARQGVSPERTEGPGVFYRFPVAKLRLKLPRGSSIALIANHRQVRSIRTPQTPKPADFENEAEGGAS